MPLPEIPDANVIQIDFTGCPEILERLKKIAERQDRSPEQQARFTLRSVFETQESFTRFLNATFPHIGNESLATLENEV